MQVLYVVEFDVAAEGEPGDPYHLTIEAVTSWLAKLSGDSIEPTLLQRSGRIVCRPHVPGSTKTANWTVAQGVSNVATRIEIEDKDGDSDSTFLTRVTVGQTEMGTTLRISMAQRSSPTWLSPSAPADLRQPGVLGDILKRADLALSIREQRQDGRFLQIRSDGAVEVLCDALRGRERLPILLVHTRTMEAVDMAFRVASRLVGLVRVVTLDYRASELLESELTGFGPPYAGARLVWSDPSAPSVRFDEALVNEASPESMRQRLMRLLAPASVLARGVDKAFREAQREGIRKRDREARDRADRAESLGDVRGQLAALQEELAAAQEAAEEWERLAIEEEERANRAQVDAEEVPSLRAQVEQLSVALQVAQEQYGGPSVRDVVEVPGLVTGDNASAEDLFNYLEHTAAGRIVFTERAAISWKRSKYPFPQEMAECLEKLARMAVALYEEEREGMPHLDSWVRTRFDLKIALQDDVIESNSKLRDFYFEGSTYNRTPHVKVRDYAPPTQVGRIHFALDPSGRRVIVDHVGLKLHSL